MLTKNDLEVLPSFGKLKGKIFFKFCCDEWFLVEKKCPTSAPEERKIFYDVL
jgi:hypothetical protein